jgi:hypothetical protein
VCEDLSSEPPCCDRIFVGHLPAETTPEQIRAAFTLAGVHVGAIEIVLSRATGGQRGFAFVDLDGRLDERVDAPVFARLRCAELGGHPLQIRGVPVRAGWR